MSEKRFTVDDDGIYDTQEKRHFKFIAYDWMECDIYECCEKLNEQQDTITDLERKLRILTAYLLSDECALTDGQIRKIRKELDDE